MSLYLSFTTHITCCCIWSGTEASWTTWMSMICLQGQVHASRQDPPFFSVIMSTMAGPAKTRWQPMHQDSSRIYGQSCFLLDKFKKHSFACFHKIQNDRFNLLARTSAESSSILTSWNEINPASTIKKTALIMVLVLQLLQSWPTEWITQLKVMLGWVEMWLSWGFDNNLVWLQQGRLLVASCYS